MAHAPVEGEARSAGLDEMFCALHEGKVHCWGHGKYLSRLLPRESISLSSLETIPLARPAKRIGVGYDHACALTDDDHLWCWGLDDGGQLGVGRVAMSYRPIHAVTLQ